MDSEGILSIYLALAGMQATLVTLIVAGLIAIYQIVGKQTPKRSLNAVVSLPTQIIFTIYAAIIFVGTLICAWTLATGGTGAEIARDTTFLLLIITATVSSYVIFAIVLFKGRVLFDDTKYIELAAKQFTSKKLSDYLFLHYSSPPFNFNYGILSYLLSDKNEEEHEQDQKEKQNEFEKDKLEYEARIKRLGEAKNPLGELFQYSLKSNNQDDIEDVVMPLITAKLVKFISGSKDVSYLSRYVKDTVEAMVASRSGHPDIGTKRAYIDMVVALANALIAQKQYSAATSIASNVHSITRGDMNETMRLYGMKALENITDEYNRSASDTKDWRKYLEPYQDLTMIAARIAENYYHSIKEMTPIGIIEDNHHEVETFHSVMANYFLQNETLYEKYPDALPALYFDSIDLSAEAFAGAISRSESVAQNVGVTHSSYNNTLDSFYRVFYAYGKYGIESAHYKLTNNCVFRLRRGLKFCSEHELTDATVSIAGELYHLGVMLTSLADDVSFSNFTTHDKGKLLEKIANDINEYVLDMEQFKGNKSGLDHTLFDYIYKEEAAQFVDLIDWDRDELPDGLAGDLLKTLG